MKTLLLDVATWDLITDANGNIAAAEDPYALAQDVASQIRTFLAEVWYDTTLGIPYASQILGKNPPVSVLQEYLVNAALTARPNTADVYVVKAKCVIQSFNRDTRQVFGQVQFIDSNNAAGAVSLNGTTVSVA